MTTLRTAAQQALEALAVATNCLDGYYIPRGKTTLPEIEDAIAALKAALAEPVQEPVAWMHVPHPGNGMSPMVSLSKHREPSMYAASVPLFLKEHL